MPQATDSQERLSEVLKSALDANQDGQATFGEIADRVAERGFGLFLILLALPMLVPMPPGSSGPVGLLFALLGGQMALGWTRPWLPVRVRAYNISPKILTTLQRSGVALMQRVEHLSKPRWTFMENPLMLRALGLLLVGIGVILFLPLPFLNTVPSIFILLIGIGLLNRDGVVLLLGFLLCLGVILFVLFGARFLKTHLMH